MIDLSGCDSVLSQGVSVSSCVTPTIALGMHSSIPGCRESTQLAYSHTAGDNVSGPAYVCHPSLSCALPSPLGDTKLSLKDIMMKFKEVNFQIVNLLHWGSSLVCGPGALCPSPILDVIRSTCEILKRWLDRSWRYHKPCSFLSFWPALLLLKTIEWYSITLPPMEVMIQLCDGWAPLTFLWKNLV